MKTWFAKVKGKELEWPVQRHCPALNQTDHFWNELEHTRPPHPTSIPDLINTLVVKGAQITTAMFQRD